MVFYINDIINEKTKTVVLLSKIEQDNEVVHFNFLEMLTRASLTKSLSYRGDVVYLDYVEGFDKVIPVCDPRINSTHNLTAVIQVLQGKLNSSVSVEVFMKLAERINQQIPGLNITATDLSRFFDAFKLYLNYKKEGTAQKIEYNTDLLLNKGETLAIIQDMNNKNSLSYLVGENNKTLFMNAPSDESFIRLPAYEQLSMMEDIPVPNPNAYFRCYNNPKFYSINYKDALTSDVDIHIITGNANNNDLDIQPNEERFYNSMKELIEYGIKQRYPNNTLEECIEAGYDDPKVTDYLVQLAIIVATWNWSHTGNYSRAFDYNDEDADSEFVESNDNDRDAGVEGSKAYASKGFGDSSSNKVTVDAEYFLRDYINKAIRNKNVYAPAEAVIKLSRWGNCKPSRLKLKGVDEYLDLNNLRVETMSGSFEGLEVIKTGGATYEVLGVVKALGKFPDIKYLKSLGFDYNSLNIPVGITAVKTFKGGIEQLVTFSIPNLIQYLENHNGDISNITIKGDSIDSNLEFEGDSVLTLEQIIQMVATSTSGERIFYRADEMLDMYMEYNQLTSTTSEISILNRFLKLKDAGEEMGAKSFGNISELMEKYAIENSIDLTGIDNSVSKSFLNGMSGLRDYFDATVANTLLPVVLDVANQNMECRMNGKEVTFKDFLNMYLIAMEKHNYSSRNKLKEEGSIESNSVASKITSDLESMSLFDNNASSATEESEEDELMKMRQELIMAIPEGTTLMELQSTEKDSGAKITIGYVCQVAVGGKKKYLITNNPGNHPVRQIVNANQIVKMALLDYFNALQGDIEKTYLRFTDEDSWARISSAVVKYVR